MIVISCLDYKMVKKRDIVMYLIFGNFALRLNDPLVTVAAGWNFIIF